MGSRKPDTASSGKPATAAEIIARLKKDETERLAAQGPSAEAVKQFDELLAHHEKVTPVPMQLALDLLASYGWKRDEKTFRRWMRERYGRTWGGRA